MKKLIKIGWLLGAIYFFCASIYTVHYLNPQDAIKYGVGLIFLTFPFGMLAVAVVQTLLHLFGIQSYSMVHDIILDLLIISVGYVQWFILVPFIVRSIRPQE